MKRPNPRESLFERLVCSLYREAADPIECWIWNGSKCNKGYGQIKTAGRSKRVHIAAWELVKGRKVRRGYTLDHVCRNVACWRPSHVQEVTRAVNTARGNRANPRSTAAATAARRARKVPEWLRNDPVIEAAARAIHGAEFFGDDLPEWPLTDCDGPDSYE